MSLDSDTIQSLGLVNSLRNEINRLNISGLFTINTHFSGEIKNMPPGKEVLIVRIVQEAFNNIIKHSKATTVDLSLTYYPKHIELNISDNGIGFDYKTEVKQKGSGLNNIKARALTLNGKATITSVLTKAPRYVFLFP